jgi:hypothetical protein
MCEFVVACASEAYEQNEVDMRAHHYIFAHSALPSILWEGDKLLGILGNPANQDYLQELWQSIPLSHEFARVVRGYEMSSREAHPGKTAAESVAGLDPRSFGDAIPSTGLRYSSHWLGGAHLVILVHLPKPLESTEAYFILITTSPAIRYFTLEHSVDEDGEEGTMCCEWQRSSEHLNHGEGPEPEEHAFLKHVCRILGWAETIEEPSEGQCRGLGKAIQIDLGGLEWMGPAEEAQASEWEEEANGALESDDLSRAELLFRKITEMRLKIQGPQNTIATHSTQPIVHVLRLQGRHRDAVEICDKWWLQCRRFRKIGHAETLICLRELATSLQLQGERAKAREVMAYRHELVGLAKGIDSIEEKSIREELQRFEEAAGSEEDLQPPDTSTGAKTPSRSTAQVRHQERPIALLLSYLLVEYASTLLIGIPVGLLAFSFEVVSGKLNSGLLLVVLGLSIATVVSKFATLVEGTEASRDPTWCWRWVTGLCRAAACSLVVLGGCFLIRSMFRTNASPLEAIMPLIAGGLVYLATKLRLEI